jgi:hypothetical protein
LSIQHGQKKKKSNPSTWKAAAGLRVPDQSGLHSKTLTQNKQKQKQRKPKRIPENSG